MNNKELENLIDNAKYKENSETFQKILKRIKPFKNIKEEVSLEMLEKFIFEMTKRYDFRPQWITFSGSEEERFYSVALINKKDHNYINTVYGYSIYELFIKLALRAYFEIKTGNIKKVEEDE